MNNYTKRIMNRVPDSDRLIRELSLSERIPAYSKEIFNMHLFHEYTTFIGLLYETALKPTDKYWDGKALTHCFIRNIKEFIKIFTYVKNKEFDKLDFLNRESVGMPNHINPEPIKVYGDRDRYSIGTKIDGNKTITLCYIPGDDEIKERFRLEVKEQFGAAEYPYFKMNVDYRCDGLIEYSKRVLVSKRPSGKLMSVSLPDNYRHQPTVVFNREGVVAVRDIFGYVFGKINEKDEVKTSHR